MYTYLDIKIYINIYTSWAKATAISAPQNARELCVKSLGSPAAVRNFEEIMEDCVFDAGAGVVLSILSMACTLW